MTDDLFGGLGRGAVFSPGRIYRYALWRKWGEGRLVGFVGLNPSTADEELNDPTITRCANFAKLWGGTGLVMLNLFAYRATDPKELLRQTYPNGADADDAVRRYAAACDFVVAAWGAHSLPRYPDRDREVMALITRPTYCLGTTKTGRPRHPLYLRSDTPREPFSLA